MSNSAAQMLSQTNCQANQKSVDSAHMRNDIMSEELGKHGTRTRVLGPLYSSVPTRVPSVCVGIREVTCTWINRHCANIV